MRCILTDPKGKAFHFDAAKVHRHKKTMPKREVVVAPSSSGPHMKIENCFHILFPLTGETTKKVEE